MNSTILKIVSLLCFLSCMHTHAQKESPLTPVISNEMLNIVYVGVENQLNLSVPGYESRNIYLLASGASCELKRKEGKYTLIPKTSGDVSLRAYTLKNKDTLFFQTIKYRCRNIPPFSARIGGKFPGDTLEYAMLSSLSSIATEAPSSDFRAIVLSFDISIITETGILSFHCIGPNFSPEVKQSLKSPTGIKALHLTNVKINLANEEIRTLKAAVFPVFKKD